MSEVEGLQQQVTDLEAMLGHASDTIARLEGKWRAPGAAKMGQRALVVATKPLRQVVAIRVKDGAWLTGGNSPPITILAWRELPAIPSSEGFQELV